ncbi:MAG: GT4 family glycosyltransferase PelF [Betaproteobacteria bacterium]|nr:GT4 family glycosyltransferase PelF [Betaproteobacteria bacterium]
MILPRAESADIALLLEGTFPYVSGGVSTWVYEIIRAFPKYRFALVFLGSRRADYSEPKYELPHNVVHLETHFLHDHWGTVDEVRPTAGDAQAFTAVQGLHSVFKTTTTADAGLAAFHKLVPDIMPEGRLTLEQFMHSEESWLFVADQYREHCADPSFVDYFWTVRIMHQPVWQLAGIAEKLPPVRVCHAVSTGYAGLLGALLNRSRGIPLALSEHGIYTKERKIDLYQNEWIRDNRNVFQRDPTELSYFRHMWIRFFEWLGRMCYDAADPIISLYEANRERQIADGAQRARTRVLPNGVHLARFAQLRAHRPEIAPPVLCLLGRVVPIKDTKTFIRAMRIVVNRMPDAEGWIAGPTTEDPIYAQECRELAESLGLERNVRFLGPQVVDELFPRIGLLVLSSISEALPLAVLEAFASGVPAITTDVGSCRQLIEGYEPQDQALGAAGAVVGIADPQSLAEAALALLDDPARWKAAQQAGIRRVETLYSDVTMFDSYRQVYEEALARSPIPARAVAPAAPAPRTT